MNKIVSKLNQLFRCIGDRLPTSNPIRTKFSKIWTNILSRSVEFIEIPIGGGKVKVLPSFRHLSQEYEAETIGIWRKLVSPGSVVWDVGSNIGLYSILSGKLVGETGEVNAFEPSPEAYRVSVAHLILNKLNSNCKVFQVAVSESDGGVLPFGIVDGVGVDPTNRLGSNVGVTITVPIVSLDGMLSRTRRAPNFIKVDIEGAEVFALRGASQLLSRERPIILLAVHPMFIPEFQCDVEEINKMIDAQGYESFDMKGNKTRPTEYSEYIIVPREKVTRVFERLGWTIQSND